MIKNEPFRGLSVFIIALSMLLGHAIGGVASEITPPIAASENPSVRFAEGRNDLSQEAADIISTFIAAEKNSSGLIFLIDRAYGLKPGLKDLHQVHVRTLRVFKALVDGGISPERIIISSPADKPAANSVVLKVESEMSTPPKARASSPHPPENGAQVFRFYFPKNSGEILPVDEQALANFLESASQPGTEPIVIEGYTDTDGDQEYNQILSELRALKVFQILVNNGLPSSRIAPTGRGAAKDIVVSEPGKSLQGSRRHVIVRWENKPTEEVAIPIADKSPDIQPEAVKVAAVKHGPWLNLVAFAGVLAPLGDLASHTKPAATYGVGVGKDFGIKTSTLRITLLGSNTAELAPKEADRTGALHIQFLSVVSDYLFGTGRLRPFVGAGLSQFRWNATIKQPSSSLENTGSHNDTGLLLRLGFDWALTSSLSLAPELSWHKIGGNLNESFYTGLFVLHWGI